MSKAVGTVLAFGRLLLTSSISYMNIERHCHFAEWKVPCCFKSRNRWKSLFDAYSCGCCLL